MTALAPPTATRHKTAGCRLSRAEYTALRELAARGRMTTSEYLRRLVLAEIEVQCRPVSDLFR